MSIMPMDKTRSLPMVDMRTQPAMAPKNSIIAFGMPILQEVMSESVDSVSPVTCHTHIPIKESILPMSIADSACMLGNEPTNSTMSVTAYIERLDKASVLALIRHKLSRESSFLSVLDAVMKHISRDDRSFHSNFFLTEFFHEVFFSTFVRALRFA
jgi:hypothetical protein